MFSVSLVVLPQIPSQPVYYTALESNGSPVSQESIVSDEELVRAIPSLSIKNTLWCESGWKQFDENGKVIRGKAGEWGLGQFMKGTWDAFNTERGTNLNIMKTEDQIDMVKWAWENDKQPHWTCYRLYGKSHKPIYPPLGG